MFFFTLVVLAIGLVIGFGAEQVFSDISYYKIESLEEQNRKLALALLDAQKEGLLTLEEADESRAGIKQLLKEINPAPTAQPLIERIVTAAHRGDIVEMHGRKFMLVDTRATFARK